MNHLSDKNNVIKWVVLATDLILYALCMYVCSQVFVDCCPRSIVSHPTIAVLILMLILAVYSLLIPTVIHKRLITTPEIFHRNLLVIFFTQGTFSLLWHLMTRNSSDEVYFSAILFSSALILFNVKRHLERAVLRWLRQRGKNSRHVLFVGSDPANISIYEDIMTNPATGYNVVGYFGDEGKISEKIKRLGSVAELKKALQDSKDKGANGDLGVKIDEMYVCLSRNDEDTINLLLDYCYQSVVHFYLVPRIQKTLQWRLKPEMLGNSVVFTNFQSPLEFASNRVWKRIFDIIFSSIVIVCFLPFLPLVAWKIKKQSPGPIFFKQKRTGMNGEDFDCYKLRSMHVNSKADTLQATADDPRKFPFGDFIRKYNIDELPQFWNVLKGDMSVVGPRPHMLLHTEQYSALIKEYMVRHYAKPGITGYAQITGSRGATTELWQMEERVKKDIYYLENWSFWLDIRIVFNTALTMVVHDKNAY